MEKVKDSIKIVNGLHDCELAELGLALPNGEDPKCTTEHFLKGLVIK